MSQAEILLAGNLSEQREGLDSGDVSASELIDASLARIAARADLAAVVSIRDSAARAEAEAASKRIAMGSPLSALDGVPILIKHVPPQSGFISERGAGQSDFHEFNTAGGMLMPQINLPDFPDFLQIFSTGEELVSGVEIPLLGPTARLLAAVVLVASCVLRARHSLVSPRARAR